MPFVRRSGSRIDSIKMEFNLVDNCNYACSQCSHFSPYMAVRRAELKPFAHDLAALSDVYHVRRFRFVGGEPFLHKDIASFVRAVRDSGITDAIEVVTNGSLVDRADDELYRAIDYLSISWYPDSRCDEAKIARAADRCRAFNTTLKVKKVSEFRLMQLEHPIGDETLLGRIYGSCQIAHSWYCQTFSDGYFYLCSRPLFTDAYLEQKGQGGNRLREHDGVPLHEPDLYGRLSAYLGRTDPLASCSYCLGTVGKRVPWRQMSRDERRSNEPLDLDAAESVSKGKLRHLLAWAAVENTALRIVPSLSLSRAINLAKNWVLDD